MPKHVLFWGESYDEYLYWETRDPKTLQRIKTLIKDIRRDAYHGLGKPEPLKNKQGKWSRRIDKQNRIVYRVEGDTVVIYSCRSHYDD